MSILAEAPGAAAAPRTGRDSKQVLPAPPPGQKHRLTWKWSRFGLIDYLVTAVTAGTYLYLEFATSTPDEPRWQGGVLFDDDVRDALLARSPSGRDRAAVASDFMTLAPQLLAFVDALAVPLIADHANTDVAWQMTVINLQALAITGVLSRGGHRIIARERPDVAPCQDDSGYHGLCFGGGNASFPSGHTSGAFAGAGLVCSHHLNLPLYGGGASGPAACVTMTVLATTSGVLRITSDRHYVSDVIVGAAIGAGAGFALPMLVHYREVDPEPRRALRFTIAPVASSSTLGAAVLGVF
ncbi:MAG: phosphatase PAP2 family protein [Solimonas sp.]